MPIHTANQTTVLAKEALLQDPLLPYVPTAAKPWNARRVAHLYRRMGFGASLNQIQSGLQMSPDELIDQLLQNAADLGPPDPPFWGGWTMNEYANNPDPNLVFIHRDELRKRWLSEMLDEGIRAKMALFWHSHFATELDVYSCNAYLWRYYSLIHDYAFGNFRIFAREMGKTGAMLVYLNGNLSVAGQPNENYARELMELHTLGVDGGYTQKDVQEVARCFTGWTIEEPNRGGKFRFAERVHDKGEKVVLGITIPAGGGIEDGLKVIEILSSHQSTAKFISRKLAQRFVADEPPQALIDRMATTYQKTSGDLKAVMKTMLASPEFMSAGSYKSKMKSPLEMVAGALRATGATLTNAMPAAQAIAQMGQPLYRKQEPTGYSNNGEEWLNSAGLLARINFSLALSENKLQGIRIDKDSFSTIARNMGAPEWQRR